MTSNAYTSYTGTFPDNFGFLVLDILKLGAGQTHNAPKSIHNTLSPILSYNYFHLLAHNKLESTKLAKYVSTVLAITILLPQI